MHEFYTKTSPQSYRNKSIKSFMAAYEEVDEHCLPSLSLFIFLCPFNLRVKDYAGMRHFSR